MAVASPQLKKLTTIKNNVGHSSPAVLAWQKGSSNYLALRFDGVQQIFIFDRQGKLYKKIGISSQCTGLDWDSEGDVLAVMVETPGLVLLWEAHSSKLLELDTGHKETSSAIAWSGVNKILAVATTKGNLVLYDNRTLRKIPVVGTHTKRIICAKWLKDDLVALGTVDDQISLVTKAGDTVRYLSLRGRPADLQFGCIKEDSSASGTGVQENSVSCIVADKTLFLMKFDDSPVSSSPMELGFQTRYGNILSHFWHGDGYIVVVFTAGFVVLLSSHYKEIGTELVLCELKEDLVKHSALNTKKGWISICSGTSSLEIHSASEPKNVLGTTEVSDDDGRVRPIVASQWSDDGQLLAVGTSTGDTILYLTSVPMMGGANSSQLASMSSLNDCSIFSFTQTQPTLEFTFAFQAQPNLVVMGPHHLAAIIHSTAYLYNIHKEFSQNPSHKKEFNSNISEFVLNHAYCAARCGSNVQLNRIEGNGSEKNDVKMFPEANQKNMKITSIALSKELFFYGGEAGQVKLFHLDQFLEIMSIEIPTLAMVKGIYPDAPYGGLCIFVDKHNTAFCFDVLRPNSEEPFSSKQLSNFPAKCDGILFDLDSNCRHIFLVYSNGSGRYHFYSGWRDAMDSKEDVEFVGYLEAFKSSGADYKPICFKKGVICALSGSGRIERSKCVYHQQLEGDGIISTPNLSTSTSLIEQKLNIIKSLVNLRLFREAYDLCCVNSERSDSANNWKYLAEAALEFGQLEIASKAYVRSGNVGMVYTIRRIEEDIDNPFALQGEVAIIKGDFDLAEAKFLEGGLRDRALEMRRDLQEWDKAMTMADKFNSPLTSEIAREYASVMEYNRDYSSALALYQKAKKTFAPGRMSNKKAMNHVIARSMEALQASGDGDSSNDAQRRSSTSDAASSTTPLLSTVNTRDMEILLDIDKGLVRNLLRKGMESEALPLLSSISSKDVLFFKECAAILEEEKKYDKAVKLYLESGEETKAAGCYIRLKQFAKAEEILKKKSVPELWRHLAKAKEAAGNHVEAAKAYADACDYENGIRLYLTLGIPEEAATLARMSDDPQDSVKVALYYLEKGDLNEALTYLIRSECYDDALANAFKYGKTEFYADFVFNHFEGDYPEGFKSGLTQAAVDFEGKKDYFRAGKCHQYLKNYEKSFHYLMKAAQNTVHANEERILISLMHTVIYAEDDDMSRQLVEFLLGENDGNPKDPGFLHYFYVKAEKFVEATKTALIVSRYYQDTGKFMDARHEVFDSMCWMKEACRKFSKETIDQFNQTHSYMLLKTLLNRKEKTIPARLIKRIFETISRFRKACPGLLLAGVNTCQQADLKDSARQMAFLLVKEYKNELDDKFKPAIEQLVRKTGKIAVADAKDSISPCPYCSQDVPDFSLDCSFCRGLIPMCIVTGQHIIKNDLGACPGCDFPFRFGEMLRLQSLVKECPLCETNWDGSDMKRLNDVRPYLYEGCG